MRTFSAEVIATQQCNRGLFWRESTKKEAIYDMTALHKNRNVILEDQLGTSTCSGSDERDNGGRVVSPYLVLLESSTNQESGNLLRTVAKQLNATVESPNQQDFANITRQRPINPLDSLPPIARHGKEALLQRSGIIFMLG